LFRAHLEGSNELRAAGSCADGHLNKQYRPAVAVEFWTECCARMQLSACDLVWQFVRSFCGNFFC